ncbi:MAG: C39 family peptidase [Coriobacteriaceae bacterium]|nr:C39 family peptidase [Coriobacteriaceae bacterium]
MCRLKLLAAFLTGMASCLMLTGITVLTAPNDPTERPRQTEQSTAIISDAPAPIVPIYMQTDERWGGLPYAGAELSDSGCGLTCAAMAWSYFSGEDWTPVDMLNAVGNDFVQDGQNYMPGFCMWMHEQDDTVTSSVIYEDMARALEDLSSGSLVFAEMQGQLEESGRSYGGHIVLLAESDGKSVTIHDPCSAYAIVLTYEQMADVDWGYFISIGRA